MSDLSERLARSLEARDAGGARFGAAAAADHALALERVWTGRAAGLLVQGGTPEDGGDARHLAAAAGACWNRGKPPMLVELELAESELSLVSHRQPIGASGVFERAYLLQDRDLLLLGIGLELYDPDVLAGFLSAWLDRRPRSRAALFAWTPYGADVLSTRYGAAFWWRFRQQLAEVSV